MELGERGYDITVGKALLARVGEYFNLNRKVLIVTDTGVPLEYSKEIAKSAKEPTVITVPAGEGSKDMKNVELMCQKMLDLSFSRSDCVVAVGGGVVGDLAGFAASVYMRGIDFYNVPTTLLSQVDSSIGGKTAVNLSGIKNVVGSFYQPKAVLIDTEVLKSLPQRQIASGLAEAIKMAITSDKELFELIENEDIAQNLEKIIVGALKIKKSVVEADEREAGLRKILNFGHTLGHGIEAECEMKGLFHGDCIALGMIPMCAPEVLKRVLPVLNKAGIDTSYKYDLEKALTFVSHDKKCSGGAVEAIFSDEIGTYRIEKIEIEKYCELVRRALNK